MFKRRKENNNKVLIMVWSINYKNQEGKIFIEVGKICLTYTTYSRSVGYLFMD